MMNNNTKARDVATVGLMIAVIEACKFAFAQLPNIELTSFFIIMFTLYFGTKTLFAIPAIIIIEALFYGYEIMWVTAYCYVWPMLFLLAMLFRRFKNAYSMAMLSGIFGFAFGFLCSFPYLFVSTATNPTAGLASAIAYWIAGIPFDIIHGISNFIIMAVLFVPVSKIFERILSDRNRNI